MLLGRLLVTHQEGLRQATLAFSVEREGPYPGAEFYAQRKVLCSEPE